MLQGWISVHLVQPVCVCGGGTHHIAHNMQQGNGRSMVREHRPSRLECSDVAAHASWPEPCVLVHTALLHVHYNTSCFGQLLQPLGPGAHLTAHAQGNAVRLCPFAVYVCCRWPSMWVLRKDSTCLKVGSPSTHCSTWARMYWSRKRSSDRCRSRRHQKLQCRTCGGRLLLRRL